MRTANDIGMAALRALLGQQGSRMTPLVFENHRQLNDFIREQGPLPTDREVRLGDRVVLTGLAPATNDQGAA